MRSIEKYPKTDSALFEEEIDVVVAVMKDLLSDFAGNGAYILTGQRIGDAHDERILSFEIKHADEEMARLEKAVKRALKEEESNLIMWFKHEPVLILNASYGRFVCGFFGNDPEWDVAILAATAVTLTRLSSLDGCLMGSYKDVPWAEAADELPIIVNRVSDIFINHRLRAIRDWESWRRFTKLNEEPFFVA